MRVLLKISGEALGGEKEYGVDSSFLKKLAQDIKEIQEKNIEIVIVLGGGNIYRGASKEDHMDRSLGDYVGMLATVMNGVHIHNALKNVGCNSIIMSAIDIPQIGEKFIRRNGIEHIKNGNIVICVGGTGNPFFTTDSTGVLRALELDCDLMVKATKVDGVYDKDPKKYSDAVLFKELTYDEVIKNDLKVMDQTGIALAREGKLKLKVVNLFKEKSLLNACVGDEGTVIN